MKPHYLLSLYLIALCGSLCAQEEQEQPGQPTFSHAHGLYDKAFTLSMTASQDRRTIHYTLDGSRPTVSSPTYSTPLTISGTTIVRAAEAVTPDSLSAATTASFLFPADIIHQANDDNGNPIIPEGLPSTWGNFIAIQGIAPAYYAMDSHLVNESTDKVLAGFHDLPIVSVVTDKGYIFNDEIDDENGGIYIYTGAPIGSGVGREWQRPTSVELIGGSEEHDLTVDCGIKIHGGHSRVPEKNPKHAFRLMFKSKFGGPSKLRYPVFGDEGVSKFEDLVLRTYFGNTWTHWDEGNRTKAQYTRDLWARSVQERLGMPHSKGQPVHLFLNGMYWGMYNLCERIKSDYCAAHFGGKTSEYDVIKVEEMEGEAVTAADGDLEAWKKMVKEVERTSTTGNYSYYRLQGLTSKGEPDPTLQPLLDMDNFIDYMLINIYAGNTDWDHHNWYAIRNRENPDCGFRFICWDTELIFGSENENVTRKDNAGKPSHFLQCLMHSSKFKTRFNHRAHLLLADEGGLLTPEGAVEVWDSLYHIIENAIYDESARWGDYRRDIHPYTSAGHRYRVSTYYQKERDRLLTNYFPNRTATVIQQLKSQGWYQTADDIDELPELASENADRQRPTTTGAYNLAGQRVDATYHGLVIINGKKYIQR